MADSDRQYPDMIYHGAGKNTFIELYDALSIGKVELRITEYDPQRTENKVTNRVSYYLEPAELLAMGKLASVGRLGAFLEGKQFPGIRFGIPKSGEKMRQWQMSATDKGRFQITITEKTRKSEWNDPSSQLLGKASFFLHPFELIVMASKLEMYLIAHAGQPFSPREEPELTLE